MSVNGAQYAGITLIDEGGIRTLAATHDYPRLLDDVQRDVGQGPCLSAAWIQHIIRIDDLPEEMRWPRYRDAVVAQTPIRSVLSIRLADRGKAISALNFYADAAGAFDDDSVEQGLIFASHTVLTWTALDREQRFQSALASRDVIGQAKGMLMERFDIDAVAAFELLRKLSQERNVKLVEIAQRLIDADH
ncbi:ANTAR domain-containing protein [Mycolicibacterium aromaticivorans]|uniref:ANTAR domain-containing protein n=1 Tax=Mycolicibacterium aromaticivorans TaxID=318425 RepID=UPI003B502BED